MARTGSRGVEAVTVRAFAADLEPEVTPLDLERLARVVDDAVFRPPSEREVEARLYGVVLAPGLVVPDLRLLEKGDAKRMLRRVRPPRGLTALALAVHGWRAPLEREGAGWARPSRHPDRRRVHITSVVAGDGDLVAVVRSATDATTGAVEVLPGGEGVMPDLLRHCWWRARARATGRAAADGAPWRLPPSTTAAP